MTKAERGWYAQVPPKPIKPYTVREENGTIRTTTVKWWSQEEMIAALTPETTSTQDYKVFVKEPPAGFTGPEADDEGGDGAAEQQRRRRNK
jgi:hypothetical protein